MKLKRHIDLEEEENEIDLEQATEKSQIVKIFEAVTQKFEYRNNSIRQVIEFTPIDKNKWRDFEEEDLNSLWLDFQVNSDFSKKPSVAILDRLLKSKWIRKYHPMRNFFKNLEWDGKDHITELANSVTCSEILIDFESKKKKISIFWPMLFKRWLISAASCSCGYTQNHVMLLFVGGQGTGKTTFLNNLTPPRLYNYLFTGHIQTDLDRQTADLLAEKFIINIDDQLQRIFDKDFDKIKGIISASSVTNRKAYRRDEKKRDRIANFVGSVNKDKIFEDLENRRYLTIPIEKINYTKKINIDQVWAQAYTLYKNGERPWFDSQETELINAINSEFAHVSNEEEFLRKLYDSVDPQEIGARYVMFSEIYANLCKYSKLRLNNNRVQLAIKKLGWSAPVSKRIGGDKTPRYVYAVKEKFELDSYENIRVDNSDQEPTDLTGEIEQNLFND